MYAEWLKSTVSNNSFDSLNFFNSSLCIATMFVILLFYPFKGSLNSVNQCNGFYSIFSISYRIVQPCLIFLFNIYSPQQFCFNIMNCFFLCFPFVTLHSYDKKNIMFQFLDCDVETQKAIDYDKHANNKYIDPFLHNKLINFHNFAPPKTFGLSFASSSSFQPLKHEFSIKKKVQTVCLTECGIIILLF